MNAFSFIFVLGVIASASAGPLAPAAFLVNAYNAIPPQLLPTPVVAKGIIREGGSLEGRYIPDNFEQLYDDGSYKPEISRLPLTVSPYGLVPAGSGLEGQYVPDNLERLYDDGSYKPEVNPVPLSPSPYGLVPSGSGLEGQYVPDVSERLFGDGYYRYATVV